ncbi:MAG TPA: asparaginase [Rhodospirillales bacterium]
MPANKPLTVEVSRGDMVESRHLGAALVVDGRGRTVRAWGDTGRLIYPRSSIKPLQALALIETGAADGFAVSETELALASASHGGTPEHTGPVLAWLERLGLGEADLECGGHPPMDEKAAKALVRAGKAAGPVCNNCSGKHAGFLTTAKHLKEPTQGYSKIGHPVQARLRRILAELGDADPAKAPTGIDGCGIPVYGMPLSGLARALARMAAGDGLDADRRRAARRIVAAMTAHPRLVAGPDRFDTLAMQAAGGAFVVKGGAEGVHAAIIPKLGFGVALKIDDGAKRAAEVAMAAILAHLGVLPEAAAGLSAAPVFNAAGARVGVVRMEEGWNA